MQKLLAEGYVGHAGGGSGEDGRRCVHHHYDAIVTDNCFPMRGFTTNLFSRVFSAFFECFFIEKRHEKGIEKTSKNGQKTRRETS
jgi:hypothetical protein